MFVFTARTLLERDGARTRPTCFAPYVRRSRSDTRISISFASASTHSPPAPRSAWIMPWRNARPTPRSCRSISAGQMSAVGMRCGNWDDKDATGNVTVGDVLLESARNCYVRSDSMLAAVVGLEDAIVVVTEDAVLATHRDHAQDVKKIVDRLKAVGRLEAVAHNHLYRPWGFFESLIQGERFQVKRLVVSPGRKLSLQKHFHRAEHWVVVHGSALVTRDDETLLVGENESIYLPLGCVHRLENPGKIPLTVIEVQSGTYLGEDDIVRLDDVYNRTSLD